VGAARVDVVESASYGPGEGRQERAAMVLGAKLAGLNAAPPSLPDAFRMALPAGKVSRRSLLSTAGVRYVPVAIVGEVGCRGSVQCGLCVEACPVDAIARGGRVPDVQGEACIGCGACVRACPVEGAARLPGADLVRFEAELERLAEWADGAGILVRCSGSSRTPDDRLAGTWLPVDVPCLSVVSPAWALGASAAGVPAMAFRGCGTACRAGAPDHVRPAVAFVEATLGRVGVVDPSARVRLMLPEEDDLPSSGPDPADLEPLGHGFQIKLREPGASEAALAALGAGSGVVTGEGSPFGRLELDVDGCTMCGLCARVCPTGAIRFDQGPVAATLEVARSACVACDHCAAICPEGVISIERGVDLELLGRGTEPLKRSALARCRRCGEPVAPAAMLERLRPLLDPAVLGSTEGLCQRCRGQR
jgi:ferredoxin